MRKLFQRIDSISLRMLLSYLSILLVPLCLIVAIYGMAMNAILVSRQDTALTALKETANIMTARLEELGNISSYIYSDTNTNAIINRSRFEPKPRNIYTFYQAIDSLPSYKLTNQMISDVYIFFNEAEFIIKQPSAFAFTEYNYNSHVHFHGISYDEIRALSEARYSGSLLVRQDDAGRDVLLLRSIPNSLTPDGLIAIQLDTAMVDSIMSTNDTGPGGAAYVLTRDGQIVSDLGDASFSAEDLAAFPGQARRAYREIKHAGREYLLCQVEESGLTYLTLTEKSYLLSSLASIKYLIAFMGAAALLLGALICIILWRRRSRVYRNIATTARSVGVEYRPAKSESHLLEYTVNTLASTVDTLRETMDLQRDALRQSVVQGCLAGTFPSRADMIREVSALDLDLFAACYHVVRVHLLDPWEVRAQSTQILPYRIFLKQFFAEHLPIAHVISDIDGTSFALLLTEEAAHSEQALVALFRTLSKQVGERDWEIPSFAISDGCTDLWGVSGLYAQTERITELIALLERRGVCCSGDLPQAKDAMYFPIDLEIRLIQVMQGGTPEALASLLDHILAENLERRTLGIDALNALFESLRNSMLRAAQEAGDQLDISAAVAALASAKSLADLRSYAAWIQEQISKASEIHSREGDLLLREKLQQAIDDNLSNPLFNLYMLSGLVNIPESTLYRTFKDYFGISFSNHLEQRRINLAFELLKDQVLIKDVAAMVGYTSDHTFRRAFKRVMKVPPGQFAKLTHTP